MAPLDRREPDESERRRRVPATRWSPPGSRARRPRARSSSPLNSPYVKGSTLLLNRLKKRDWLLATYRKLNRLDPHSLAIERRHRLPRAEFLEEYYSTNRPVIITGMMDDWPAMRKWNLDYFAQQFGDREVEVQFGRTAGDNYEVEREKYITKLKFADYVNKVRTAGVTNDFYMTASNNSANKTALAGLWNDIVQLPEYLDGRDPRNGFFWMGPAGTITPFHHDLTNNFMAQVIGRKRVKFAPSWDIPLMDNHFHVFSRVDGRITPPRPQPAARRAADHRMHPQPGRDPVPADRLPAFRRRGRHHGDRLVHQLRLR